MLDCPGNSRDLNPIEILWSFVKIKVSEKHFSSLDALPAAITEVWEREISPDYCCKLIDSMPRRMQEAIRNNGGPTKY